MEEASEALDGTFFIFFLHFDDVDDGKRARRWKFCKFDIDLLATHTYKMFFVIHIQYDPSLKFTHTTTNMILTYSQHTHKCFSSYIYDPSLKLTHTTTALHDVSQLLDTGLDKETLSILVSLCEMGVNPEALANIVKELRQLKEETSPSSSSVQ